MKKILKNGVKHWRFYVPYSLGILLASSFGTVVADKMGWPRWSPFAMLTVICIPANLLYLRAREKADRTKQEVLSRMQDWRVTK